MSSFIKVNVSTLSSCQGEFSDEQSYFNNNTYTTFSNGYVCSCGDQYISQMASHMLTCYDTLKAGYTNINDWWTSYVSDVETLENVLSGQSDLGEITSPELIAALGKLYNTDNYDNTLEGEYTGEEDPSIFGIDDQSTIDAAYNQGEVEGKDNVLVGLSKEYLTKVTDSCVDIYNDDGTINVMNVIKNIGTIRLNMIKITTATQTTGCLGLAEGVLKFVESLADAGVSLVTIGATGLQTLNGILNGTDYKKANEELWEQTKSFIAKDHVTSLFNKFYETEAGSVIKNNTVAFDAVRGITKGIGNTIGVVGLATVTGGSSLAIGGLAGYGRGLEEAYASGAGTWEGQGYAALKGLWEAGQFALSGATKGLTMDNRIMLDGFSGAAEAIVDPYAKAIYQKGTYDENGNYNAFTSDDSYVDRVNKIFEANGGWKNVLIQGASSSATSAISEAFDYLKSKNKVSPKVVEGEIVPDDNFIENPKPELPPNQTIIDVEGERIGVDYETLDGDVIKDLPTGSKDLIEEFDAKGIGDGPVKGLSPGSGDIDVTTNSKNLTGDVSTEKLGIFEEPEIPKTKGTGSSGDIETLSREEAKPITAIAGATGDTSVLKALDDANVPKTNRSGLTDKVETLSMDSTKPVFAVTEATGDTSALRALDDVDVPKTFTDIKGDLYTLPTSRELTSREIEALKEFDFYMSDGKSLATVVGNVRNALIESMKSGNDDAYYYLKAINKLKIINPDLNFSACGDAASHWSRSNLSLQLDDEAILGNHFSTSYHESGHMLWNLINGETLPNNWDDIVRRAQTHASEDARFGRTIFNLEIQYNDLVDTARRKFSDMIYQTKNMSLNEYYSSIKNKYVSELSQSGNITDVLRKAGLNDNSINSFFSTNAKVSLDDLATYAANAEYNNLLNKFQNNLAYTEFPSLVAESDMVNAVYKTMRNQDGTYFLHYGHPEGYYYRNSISSLHELIANFTELKLINDIPSQRAIYEFKELFGDELYSVLDDLYKGFLEFGK